MRDSMSHTLSQGTQTLINPRPRAGREIVISCLLVPASLAVRGVLSRIIDALSRSEERILESHLTRLMQYIIKWHVQPERRSESWVATINEPRRQIRRLQQRHPRFTDRPIRDTL